MSKMGGPDPMTWGQFENHARCECDDAGNENNLCNDCAKEVKIFFHD